MMPAAEILKTVVREPKTGYCRHHGRYQPVTIPKYLLILNDYSNHRLSIDR